MMGVLLLPVYGPMFDRLEAFFAWLFVKDVIRSDKGPRKYANNILEYLTQERFGYIRRFVSKKHLNDVARYLTQCSYKDLTDFGSTDIVMSVGNRKQQYYIPSYWLAIKNIALMNSENFEVLEKIVIENSQHNLIPKQILEFAILMKDVNVSKKTLFAAVAKLSVDYKNAFVDAFEDDPQIAKLAGLS